MCFAAIGVVASLAGGIVSAMGAQQQGKAQEAQYKAQAQYQKRQAIMEEISGGWEAYKVDQKGIQIAGAQEAGYAAGGIEGQVVSDTISESVKQNQLDKEAIRFSTQAKASNDRYQAEIYKMQAKQAKQAGQINAISALIGAGTNIMGAFA